MKQELRIYVLIDRRRHAPKEEVNLAFAQNAELLRIRRHRYYMHGDSRMLLVKPVKQRGDQAGNHGIMRADPDFANRWISQEFDVLHGLAQVIEGGQSALKQSAAVLGRLGAVTTTIKESDSDGMFKVGDRFRNGRLRRIQELGRPAHAPGLCDRHQYVQVVQFDAASDAI